MKALRNLVWLYMPYIVLGFISLLCIVPLLYAFIPGAAYAFFGVDLLGYGR